MKLTPPNLSDKGMRTCQRCLTPLFSGNPESQDLEPRQLCDHCRHLVEAAVRRQAIHDYDRTHGIRRRNFI